ncbi:unnamed protein product [Rotaria sordida]|uniref:TIR domain-containing protein n=1 Tax=Rotaria sordida TaxID=392033 RepID=A0A814WMX5_9BILA|nr:unnamed protein product [Rotaria sordida]CAF1200554.1 unnamed protein product [Rotaria sordida]CAF3743420.1 unnamed protein product [Rotaria sordida]
MTVMDHIWTMIGSKLGELIEKEILSAKEYYTIAMNGLSTNEFSKYLIGFDVETIFKFYVKIFLKLTEIVILADSRHMEHLNLSDYTAHKSLHDKRYDAVFFKIITFIDRFFVDSEKDAARQECIEIIFSLIVTMSDSKILLPTIIHFDFPAKLVEWLNVISKRNISSDPLDSLIVAMSNVSQYEEGAIALNEAGAIAAIEISEKALANRLEKNQFTLSFYPRIYAMISTADQVKTLNVLKPAIDFLLTKIREANASTDLRSKTGHLYEYLVPLAKLLVNDNIAIYLLNDNVLGGLTFFLELFFKHNILPVNDLFVKHLIRLALYNILCSLAFHESVQQQLKTNQIFIKAVLEASNSSIINTETFIPSSLRNNLMSVKTAAHGILVYLDKFKISISNNNELFNTSATKIPMISYSHQDADFCRSVVTALKEHSISVWIDEDGHCLSNDCWEEIAIAIKNASKVLIIVSENYCTKSRSCRVEASYTIKLGIPIIALYIDDEYEAEPWLDIHLTGLHVKFGNKPFAERIDRLAKYITANNDSLKCMKTSQTQMVNSSRKVLIPTIENDDKSSLKTKVSEPIIDYFMPKTSPHTWSKVEVRTWWCTERILVPQLCTFCDGEALCIYARIFLHHYQQDPLKHLQSLREQLKHEHGINFYDDHYANMASSMMWIVKQKENDEYVVNKYSKWTSCILM